MENTSNVAEKLNELQVAHMAQIAAFNAAMSEENMDATNKATSALTTIEADYAALKAKAIYEGFRDVGDHFAIKKEAILQRRYDVLSHVFEKADGVIVGAEASVKSKRIDIFKLCSYLNIDVKWQLAIERLNGLMTLRVAKELDFPLEKVVDTYFMQKTVEKIKLGETPTSNTRLCKAVQGVIDKILLDADDKKENKIKCNNWDIDYILKLYTRQGKADLSVKTAKHDVLRSLIVDVIYRVLTGGRYPVEFKTIKV